MKCPICDNEKCEELIIDLVQCTNCSHIFKKEMNKDKVPLITHLHMLNENIIEWIREYVSKNMGETIDFEFPSMILFTMEVKPNDFYNDKFNHYFNQLSLNILLERCGLEPIEQINRYQNKICTTYLRAKKEE